MPSGDRPRKWRRRAIAVAACLMLVTVACWPSNRFVGINFVVTRETLPLWAKAVNFIDRDVNLARTARIVVRDAADDDTKAAAAFAWTRANIRPQPANLPVVDDHIWHIIVRGYGKSDQQADVFTTLLAYTGVRAYWMLAGDPPDEIPISYVRIRGRWRVYDVANGIIFRDHQGGLATPEDLAGDRRLIRAAAADARLDVAGYEALFQNYQAAEAPDVLRADLQMPGRRLLHEVKSVVGLEGRTWQMRPAGAAKVWQP